MNYTSLSLVIIFFGHWVGDYLFQTSDMAQQKSRSLKWLSLHVVVYFTTLLAFSFFAWSAEIAWRYALLNAALHGITDLFTSKLASKYSDRPRIFYPIIGFDQFIHAISLVLTREIWL